MSETNGLRNGLRTCVLIGSTLTLLLLFLQVFPRVFRSKQGSELLLGTDLEQLSSTFNPSFHLRPLFLPSLSMASVLSSDLGE